MKSTSKEDINWVNGFLLGMILLFLSAIVFVNLFSFVRYCNSDVYGEQYLSKLVWEQKTLFPDNWIFGNQFYVFTSTTFCALLYGITGSINLSMGLASCIMTALLLLSFVWFIRPYVTKQEVLVGILTILSAVICYDIAADNRGQILYLLAAYYSGYLIMLFAIWGFFVRLTSEVKMKHPKGAYALCLLFSFIGGIQSLRQTVTVILPLVITAGLVVVVSYYKKRKLEKKDQNLLIVSISFLLSNVLGVIVIRLLHIPNIAIFEPVESFDLYDFLVRLFNSVMRFKKFIVGNNFIEIFTGQALWYEPIMMVLSLIVFGIVCWTGVDLIRQKKIFDTWGIYYILSGLSILGVMFSMPLLNIEQKERYYFTWYVLVAISVLWTIKRTKEKKKFMYGLCLFALISFTTSYLPTIYKTVSKPSFKYEAVKFMKDNGYDIIYGNWHTAGSIAAASDGEILGAKWERGDILEHAFIIQDMINIPDIYSEEDNKRAVYAVRSDNRRDLFFKCKEMGAHLKRVAWFWDDEHKYKIYFYTSDRQLMYRRYPGTEELP